MDQLELSFKDRHFLVQISNQLFLFLHSFRVTRLQFALKVFYLLEELVVQFLQKSQLLTTFFLAYFKI